MSGIVAVHCGAGHHSSKYHKNYKSICKRACREAVLVLKRGGSALDAVKQAIIVLENDPITNAGFGSNLTTQGIVEGDASIMDGKSLTFGGCGSVKKVKNPITLAYDVCMKQFQSLPLGLVPPSLLVGPGALQHAREAGLRVVSNKKMISEKAFKQFRKYKQMLDKQEDGKLFDSAGTVGIDDNEHLVTGFRKYKQIVNKQEGSKLLDTVGAVCIDDTGHMASGCSSGGLLLKKPGRVGQAALYGSGTWADSFDKDNENSVAVCTTGCGEYLVQTQLAKEISDDLKRSTCPTTDLHKSMTEKFLKSRYLRNVKQKMGGALVLHANKNGEISLLWGHSTDTMGIAYMKTTDLNPKGLMSTLPGDVPIGQSINVGGTYFCR